MTDVLLEEADLDAGIPVMYRDCGTHVRAAYDPQQADEATALALIFWRVPRLIGDYRLIHIVR